MAYQAQCKVCNSKMRSFIEELAVKNLSPDRIYETLQALQAPQDRRVVMAEDIKPSSIRRHLQRHFDAKEERLVDDASVKSKVRKSRSEYETGQRITVDAPNVLAHLVEMALARIQECERLPDKEKHPLIVKYMTQVTATVDKLVKVSGETKREEAIDSDFFQNEVKTFAELVLATIRTLDQQYGLNYQLEVAFSQEFKKQWAIYQRRQQLILEGKLPPSDGAKDRSVNRFNEAGNMV